METESQKSVSSVHLNMKVDVSSKHISTNCPSILRLLSIILIAYPILNPQNYLEYTSQTQMVRFVGMAFSARQNAENENPHTHTKQVQY
jgi:hypothetical protein